MWWTRQILNYLIECEDGTDRRKAKSRLAATPPPNRPGWRRTARRPDQRWRPRPHPDPRSWAGPAWQPSPRSASASRSRDRIALPLAETWSPCSSPSAKWSGPHKAAEQGHKLNINESSYVLLCIQTCNLFFPHFDAFSALINLFYSTSIQWPREFNAMHINRKSTSKSNVLLTTQTNTANTSTHPKRETRK